MITYRTSVFWLISAALLLCTVDVAWADRDGRFAERRPAVRQVDKGYVLDKRHRHNQYYPRQGHVVKRLPDRPHRVTHRGTHFYYSSGIWYRPSGAYFTVTVPPVGVIVPVLPHLYTTVWIGGEPYYYAAGTYYRWYPERRGYIVTEPPKDSDVYEQAQVQDQVFVYPRAGQDEEKQSLDRYECHRWAVDQSGFDPTRPGGNVTLAENLERRADYNRATKACLEARDYSVQ